MPSVLFAIGLFVASIVVRANVYDIQAESQKTIFLYEKVNGEYKYYKVKVENND